MVRTSNKSIGLLGGSFDPAHKGHIAISKIAIKKKKLNKVLWTVVKKNPFKSKTFYSLSNRIKIAKELTKYTKKIKVIHLDKVIGSSRSIDAINYLINKKKLKNIYFIIGSDNLIKFHKWKSWKKIVKLTKLSFLELSRKLDAGGLSKDLINIVNNKTDAILSSSDNQCLLEELPDLIEKLEIKMKDAAKELNFEEAANLRDRIKKLRQKLARNN